MPDYVRLSIGPARDGRNEVKIYNPHILPSALVEKLTSAPFDLSMRLEGEEVPSSTISGPLSVNDEALGGSAVTDLIRSYGLEILLVPGVSR